MIPVAKQSFRHTRSGHAYQPKKIIDSSNLIRIQSQYQLPKGFKPYTKGVIITKLHFLFPPTKAMEKSKYFGIAMSNQELIYKTTKPDVDNLIKNLSDSLQGLVFVNDGQIVALDGVKKLYSLKPGIEIELEEI